jgi:hypothetical protein
MAQIQFYHQRLCVSNLALDLRGGDRLLMANGGGLRGLRDDRGRLGLRTSLSVRPGCVGVERGSMQARCATEKPVTSKTNSDWTGAQPKRCKNTYTHARGGGHAVKYDEECRLIGLTFKHREAPAQGSTKQSG